MKICKNCTAENNIHVEKCVRCNMRGNFTYLEMPGEGRNLEVITPNCTNCGCQNPGEGAKCIQCHFPLGKTNSQSAIPAVQNNKEKTGANLPD